LNSYPFIPISEADIGRILQIHVTAKVIYPVTYDGFSFQEKSMFLNSDLELLVASSEQMQLKTQTESANNNF
jgi:hypothetical protein